jgi:hypothetical protein
LIVSALVAFPVSARDDALARLAHDLASGASATLVLTQWCGDLHLANPPKIRAERDPRVTPADAQIRALLDVDDRTIIAYRRVKLACGDHVLSESDNWYVPGRLTPAMNRTLDSSDTPFGTVAAPLHFQRKTLAAGPVRQGRTIFRVKAVLLTPENRPFSLVMENYQRDLLGH